MYKFVSPRYIIPALIVGLAGLAVLYYLISPLFINVRVNEALPSAAQPAATGAVAQALPVEAAATVRAVITQEPPAMKTAMADTTVHAMNEPMPVVVPLAGQSAAPVIVKQANFYNVVHEGKGKAEIVRLPDGSTLLRLEEFSVLNGPDLHVYLVPAAQVDPGVGKDITGYVDLGKLKGNQGAQNYTLPKDLDIARFRSVVIWCQPFKVPFIAATFP